MASRAAGPLRRRHHRRRLCSAYPTGPVGAFNAGDIVPVRYLPKDRSQVEVDREAMVSAAEARRAEGRAGLVRLAEEKLARGEGGES